MAVERGVDQEVKWARSSKFDLRVKSVRCLDHEKMCECDQNGTVNILRAGSLFDHPALCF